jgi:hypothetical protein
MGEVSWASCIAFQKIQIVKEHSINYYIREFASRIISQFAENGHSEKLVGGNAVKFCGGEIMVISANKEHLLFTFTNKVWNNKIFFILS